MEGKITVGGRRNVSVPSYINLFFSVLTLYLLATYFKIIANVLYVSSSHTAGTFNSASSLTFRDKSNKLYRVTLWLGHLGLQGCQHCVVRHLKVSKNLCTLSSGSRTAIPRNFGSFRNRAQRYITEDLKHSWEKLSVRTSNLETFSYLLHLSLRPSEIAHTSTFCTIFFP